MGDKLTERQKTVILRAGFVAGELDYAYGAADKTARQVVVDVLDYFDAGPGPELRGATIRVAINHATAQTFGTLCSIVEHLGAEHMQVGGGSPYLVMQQTVDQIVQRLAAAHRGLLDYEEEISPPSDAPSDDEGTAGEDDPHVL
jgi:hypothetical protein